MPKPNRDISREAGCQASGARAVRTVFRSAAEMVGQKVVVTLRLTLRNEHSYGE
jgi:hypothetical protein